jgi:hypothetical protein
MVKTEWGVIYAYRIFIGPTGCHKRIWETAADERIILKCHLNGVKWMN